MVDALCDYLTEKPGLYLEEMAAINYPTSPFLGGLDEKEMSAKGKRTEP